MTRLGFLGAMNRDLVADVAGAPVIARLGLDAVPLLETAVPDKVAARGAELLSDLDGADYLGGSAFNVARMVALLDRAPPRLAKAYFGIAGQVGGSAPHVDALKDWGVETGAVRLSADPPATCLAMVEPAGRTLLTAIGANAGITDYLADASGALADAIATCDVVHVTSYLDPNAPALMARLISAAREINPGLMLSLDPGTAWVLPGGAGFTALLAQTNLLHLNSEEFAHLCPDGDADALGTRLAGPNWMIVARSHVGASVYCRDGVHSLPPASLKVDVVDATGAGDTFCGGFLHEWLAGSGDLLVAAQKGFDLARRKIAIKGPWTGTAS